MQYEVKNFDHLLGTVGFSDPLLKNHFTLYQGYVNNFNKLNDILVAMEKDGKFGTPEYAELNRRLGWEWNGMRLHELYFGNMTPNLVTMDKESELSKDIEKEWGSLEMWEKDFKSMGAMRGIGWVILYYAPHSREQMDADKTRINADRIARNAERGRLFNVWVNEHDVGHLAGATPLLVMDVFEHAYISDYGLKRADYIESFMKAIDWNIVENRLRQK